MVALNVNAKGRETTEPFRHMNDCLKNPPSTILTNYSGVLHVET